MIYLIVLTSTAMALMADIHTKGLVPGKVSEPSNENRPNSKPPHKQGPEGRNQEGLGVGR